MRLIKRILCEIYHGIVNTVGSLFINSICHAALNTTRFISIHKALPFGINDILLFLTHGTADIICLSHRITGKFLHNLHNLLLIDDTSVGRFKNRLQFRCHIGNRILIILSLDIVWNKIHWPRPVQRNAGYNVLEILWF